MSLKMISEILKELKESLPDEVRKNYKNVFIAKNVTAILESRGLLFKNERGGRTPTRAGAALGISTELRTKRDTGEEYLQVLYNETAVESVRRILFEEYPGISTAGYTKTSLPALRGAGRAAACTIINDTGVEIVLIKHRDKYWTYDESAVKLCRMLGTEPHTNAAGEKGVAVKSEDLASSVIPILKDNGIDFAINDVCLDVYRKVALPVAPAGPVTKVGSVVVLQDASGETFSAYLAETEKFKIKAITRPDGTIELIREPVTEKNGCQILHPESPLFDEIIGKREGNIVNHNNFIYRILSIRTA